MFQVQKLGFFLVIALLFIANINLLNGIESIDVKVPDFSEGQISGAKISMRSFHETTFYLKTEVHYHNEKPLILVHNFRDGESAWTYAPARAHIAYENIQKAYQAIGKPLIPANEKVIVIGAGANGLMIANRLAAEGHPVTIYADRFFPSSLPDIHTRMFMPVLSVQKTDEQLLEYLETLSYQVYEGWANSKVHGGYHGVSPIDLYFINDDGRFNRLVKNELIPQPIAVNINLTSNNINNINNKNIIAIKYQSFVLDTVQILKEMTNRAKVLGVKCIQRQIYNWPECFELDLDAKIIINCSKIGVEENYNSNSNKIIPQIRHTVSFKNAIDNNYVIYVNHQDETHSYWIANNDMITLSGTFVVLDREGVSEGTDVTDVKRLIERVDRLAMN